MFIWAVKNRLVMRIDRIAGIAIILCAIIVIGEVLVYDEDLYERDATAVRDGNYIDFSVTFSGADVYSAVILDNGDKDPSETVYIYHDRTYEKYEDVASDAGFQCGDFDDLEKQMRNSLELRGVDCTALDSDELASRLVSDISAGIGSSLIVFSYALPQSVYSGNPGDILFQWLNAGGTLYWMDSEIGKFYTTNDGLVEVGDNQGLFFGRDCVNTGSADHSNTPITDNGITEALSIKNNYVRFGIDASELTDSLAIGYTEEGYASICFVGYGAGTVCVLAGDYSYIQFDDCSQIVAAGINEDTTLISCQNGSIIRETVSGTIEAPMDSSAYIYIGGYYTIYGRGIHGI